MHCTCRICFHNNPTSPSPLPSEVKWLSLTIRVFFTFGITLSRGYRGQRGEVGGEIEGTSQTDLGSYKDSASFYRQGRHASCFWLFSPRSRVWNRLLFGRRLALTGWPPHLASISCFRPVTGIYFAPCSFTTDETLARFCLLKRFLNCFLPHN